MSPDAGGPLLDHAGVDVEHPGEETVTASEPQRGVRALGHCFFVSSKNAVPWSGDLSLLSSG